MKECRACRHNKKLDSFYKHKEMKDGRLNICKACKRKSSRSKFSLAGGPSHSGPEEKYKPNLRIKERIRWIPGLKGLYAITSLGRPFSYTKNWATPSGGKEISTIKRKTGYYEFGASKNGGRTDILVHRAVLFSFVGPPDEGEETRHLDGEKSNNSLSNLEWNTPKKNWEDTKKHGNAELGESRYNSKLTSMDVFKIREKRENKGSSYSKISVQYPVGKSCIRKVCIGKTWKHVGGPIESTKI